MNNYLLTKLPINTRSLHNLLLYMLAAAILLSTACSKKEEIATPTKEETATLTVNIASVSEMSKVAKRASATPYTRGSQKKIMREEIKLDGFDFAVTSEQSTITDANYAYSPKVIVKQAGNGRSAMKNNISYRILLYYKKTGKFAKSSLARAGTPLQIPVVKDEEYLWYAYSYNNTENIDEVTNTENPTIETPTDKDLLHASGEISTVEGNNVIQITFAHKLTKVILEVTSQEICAQITSLSTSLANNGGFNKGDFYIKTGNTPVTQPYNTDNITLKNVTPGNNDLRTVTLYTADPNELKNFNITVNQLTVKYSDGTTEDLVKNNTPSTASFVFTDPEVGEQLFSQVKIKRQGIIFEGLEWSQGNLYLDNGVYKFRPNQVDNHFTSCNDYWHQNSLTPISESQHTNGDPCTKVLPENTWRTPTEGEMRKLVRNPQLTGGSGFIEFIPTSEKRPYLRLNQGGWNKNDRCEATNRSDGMYWTTSEGTVLEIDDKGKAKIDYAADKRRVNIRCVRTPQ